MQQLLSLKTFKKFPIICARLSFFLSLTWNSRFLLVVNSEEEGLEQAGAHPKIDFVLSFTEVT